MLRSQPGGGRVTGFTMQTVHLMVLRAARDNAVSRESLCGTTPRGDDQLRYPPDTHDWVTWMQCNSVSAAMHSVRSLENIKLRRRSGRAPPSALLADLY